jgi:uncharacterized membrane protein
MFFCVSDVTEAPGAAKTFTPFRPNPFSENRMSVSKTPFFTAAALMAISSIATAAPAPAGSSGAAVAGADTVHCYGVNSCKGTADCKTTAHDCKGMNTCKGEGFKALTAGACLKKGGVIGDLH